MKIKSVSSINLFKSVIQTIYDIIKAHGGKLKIKTKIDKGNPDAFREREDLSTEWQGTKFIIILPNI